MSSYSQTATLRASPQSKPLSIPVKTVHGDDAADRIIQRGFVFPGFPGREPTPPRSTSPVSVTFHFPKDSDATDCADRDGFAIGPDDGDLPPRFPPPAAGAYMFAAAHEGTVPANEAETPSIKRAVGSHSTIPSFPSCDRRRSSSYDEIGFFKLPPGDYWTEDEIRNACAPRLEYARFERRSPPAASSRDRETGNEVHEYHVAPPADRAGPHAKADPARKRVVFASTRAQAEEAVLSECESSGDDASEGEEGYSWRK